MEIGPDKTLILGSVHVLPTHKIRSFCAALLLILILAISSYFLMHGQYEQLLQTYQNQGQRAYVIAFTQVFLYSLFSSDTILVFLVIMLVVALLFLKTWGDGLLTGLLIGIIVALLSLYIIKNYFPETLAAGWLPIVLEKLWLGVVNGLLLGLAGALGGLMKQKIINKTPKVESVELAAKEKFYKCPKCGAQYESNPEYCSNCGRRLRRTSQK
jgi:hypothetical protein